MDEQMPPEADETRQIARATVPGRNLLVAIAVAAAILAVAFVLTLVTLRVFARPWAAAHSADIRAMFLVEAYLAILAGLLLAFGGVPGLVARLGFRFSSWRDLGLAVSVWLLTVVVGSLVTAALTPIIGRPESNAVALLRLARDPLFLALVLPTVTLLAPATEEMLFRGGLLGWLSGRLPFPAAGVVTAGVFAGAHLLPAAFAYLFLFGLGTAFVVRRTGSTFNTFAMHACQNTFAVVAAYALLNSSS
jgi:membrane protease YdiL (CAAX protease family)